MNKTLFILCLSSLCFAAKPKKNKSASVAPNPRLNMSLSGGLGLSFGSPITAWDEMLKNRGVTQKKDTLPQCNDFDQVCKKSFTTLILNDNEHSSSFASNPIFVGDAPVQNFQFNFGTTHQLESFSLEIALSDSLSAKNAFQTQNQKITEKYGIANCEVYAENDAKFCEVLTWDFGTDGMQGSIQSSLAMSTINLSYKSQQAIQQLLSGGQKLVESQNSTTNIPVKQNSSDF